MSAAATAAGYLYASGRLRGRAQREQEDHGEHHERKPAARPLRVDRPRREVRVAALPPAQGEAKPRRTPTIQYRTRRWRPNEE
ncbi:MAG TPA: hypothetical protein VEU32_13165 [Burkholderiales bacterium]|nr:hypothetical protein [Burkholderiales bacterium]